jgi:outer membrane murein-binding lipoprotein Lpp
MRAEIWDLSQDDEERLNHDFVRLIRHSLGQTESVKTPKRMEQNEKSIPDGVIDKVEWMWDWIRNDSTLNFIKNRLQQLEAQLSLNQIGKVPELVQNVQAFQAKIDALKQELYMSTYEIPVMDERIRDVESDLYDELKHPDRLTEPKMREWVDYVINENNELRKSIEQFMTKLSHKMDQLSFDMQELKQQVKSVSTK